ncbi:MAG: 30S ribosomal protein S16 [Candidatus Nephrothrix sp. EaCA]|nr:MAG: 30S ribosomal protein S16 [Candidatus Nephrothrix sp. EaCA]
MAVKIRLTRRGRRKLALYDVVVADSRSPRDGRFIEKLGTYNPLTNPASIVLNEEKAFEWLMKGAQPSPTIKAMLSYFGVLYKKHLQIGVIKGAVTQEQADQKLAEWKQAKQSKIDSKKTDVVSAKAEALKARRAAETKAKEAKAEAIRKKAEAAIADAEAAETPEGAAEPQA